MAQLAKSITPQQCKQARAMLKWNPQDLAGRTRIPAQHIQKFERNQVRLLKPEHEEIIAVFAKQSVHFFSDGEVRMKQHASSSASTSTARMEIEQYTQIDLWPTLEKKEDIPSVPGGVPGGVLQEAAEKKQKTKP